MLIGTAVLEAMELAANDAAKYKHYNLLFTFTVHAYIYKYMLILGNYISTKMLKL